MNQKHAFILETKFIFLHAVSGVLKSKEKAQDSVAFGVGVYAGSTVFNLTFLWGVCVIFGRRELLAKTATSDPSVSICGKLKEKISQLKGTFFSHT